MRRHGFLNSGEHGYLFWFILEINNNEGNQFYQHTLKYLIYNMLRFISNSISRRWLCLIRLVSRLELLCFSNMPVCLMDLDFGKPVFLALMDFEERFLCFLINMTDRLT